MSEIYPTINRDDEKKKLESQYVIERLSFPSSRVSLPFYIGRDIIIYFLTIDNNYLIFSYLSQSDSLLNSWLHNVCVCQIYSHLLSDI